MGDYATPDGSQGGWPNRHHDGARAGIAPNSTRAKLDGNEEWPRPLGVIPRDVVYRREVGVSPADAAVWTPVIVIRKEPRQRVVPLAVGVVRS